MGWADEAERVFQAKEDEAERRYEMRLRCAKERWDSGEALELLGAYMCAAWGDTAPPNRRDPKCPGVDAAATPYWLTIETVADRTLRGVESTSFKWTLRDAICEYVSENYPEYFDEREGGE